MSNIVDCPLKAYSKLQSSRKFRAFGGWSLSAETVINEEGACLELWTALFAISKQERSLNLSLIFLQQHTGS